MIAEVYQGGNLAKNLSRVLQFVLYLATANADIEPMTTGAIINRTAARKYSNKKTEVSQVGYRIGSVIRNLIFLFCITNKKCKIFSIFHLKFRKITLQKL